MSFTRSFASSITFALAACVMAIPHAIAAFAVRTYECARDLVVSAVAAFAQPTLTLLKRAVELVQACAYATRVAKRERPQVRDTWRMCPST